MKAICAVLAVVVFAACLLGGYLLLGPGLRTRTMGGPVAIVGGPVDTDRGYLGISFDAVAAANDGQQRPGVRVTKVLAGSSAEQAGLRVGDVLLNADGRPIAGVEDFRATGAQWRAHQTVEFRLIRGGKAEANEVTVSVTLMDFAELSACMAAEFDSSTRAKDRQP
jgi:S1-C subfamily serine protease